LKGLFTNLPANPDTRSVAEFGQLNWHIDDKATLTLGLRRTDERKGNSYNKIVVTDSALTTNLAATTLDGAGAATGGVYNGASAAQIAAAKAVRLTQLSSLGQIAGQPIDAVSYAWLVNPSYKLSADTLLYASLGYGEKSGSVQFNTTSMTPQNVDPEKALDFELGWKSSLLDQRLVLNLNFYQTKIKDYQQNLTVVDPSTTTGFRTYLGNVKGLTLRGVEVDGTYALHQHLNVSFSGAYNSAVYSDFSNAPCASDISGQPGGQLQCDYTGRQIPFAPKLSAAIGFDYHQPITGEYQLHGFSNIAYRGDANYNAGLSDLGLRGGYSIVDGGIGIQTQDGKWELALIGKNLADKKFVTSIGTYSNQAAVTGTPGDRRYLGVVLRVRQF
jgi:iron complex outermembrane receptor protein